MAVRYRVARGRPGVSDKEDKYSENGNSNSYSCWCPRASVVFHVLLSARISAAFLCNISDCDETFNYWEPAHYLLYGKGFQTWEYSPTYAIRSYAYILIHVLPAQLVRQIWDANKLVVFYYIRFMLAVLCAACETYFYKSVITQFGEHIARLLFIFLVFCTGMFISSAAFLPSSFAMMSCMLGFGGWYNRNYPLAIFGIALGALVGWPFCAALGIPIAYDMIFRQYKFWLFLEWSVGVFAAIMIPVVAVDSHYYGKQVIAPLNIVLYNVFGQGGPDLYGVEPWTFYFKNCFLNFNIAFVLAVVALPFCGLVEYFTQSRSKGSTSALPYWLALAPLYIWAAIFFTRPHKEERFLFPVYPLMCLAASCTLSSAQALFHRIFTPRRSQHFSSSSNWIACAVLLIFSVISISRSSALFVGYHAPLDVYAELFNRAQPTEQYPQPLFPTDKQLNVCVGKEWYRFTSSFFVPSERWNLTFLKSEFRGQLPKYYSSGRDATKTIPTHMNDMNLEEPSRYVSLDDCDLLVDLSMTRRHTELEPDYSRHKRWEVVYSKQFLDSSSSHPFFRAFYIPYISEKYTNYSPYNLLRSRRARRKARPQHDDFFS